jgi:hypothetical protein
MSPPPQSTLLVLGSKPKPNIPRAGSYAAIACANGSGHSARVHGLAKPHFTVVSAMLGSGDASECHTLAAMRGLGSEALYFLPRRPPKKKKPFGRDWRMHPLWLRWLLWRAGYRYDRFVQHSSQWYETALIGLCGGDEGTVSQMRMKRASTGVIAVGLGLSLGPFTHVIMAGFDLTLEHAYGVNPRIEKREMVRSRHDATDVHVLTSLQQRLGTLWTTEPALHARTNIPLLTP